LRLSVSEPAGFPLPDSDSASLCYILDFFFSCVFLALLARSFVFLQKTVYFFRVRTRHVLSETSFGVCPSYSGAVLLGSGR